MARTVVAGAEHRRLAQAFLDDVRAELVLGEVEEPARPSPQPRRKRANRAVLLRERAARAVLLWQDHRSKVANGERAGGRSAPACQLLDHLGLQLLVRQSHHGLHDVVPCPGRKPPFSDVKRPARPYKSATRKRLHYGKRERALNPPERARTVVVQHQLLRVLRERVREQQHLGLR